MNQHSSTAKKYYSPLIGAALVAASLFHFSFPVFAAGTEAGTVLRNTATGNYEDDTGNPYTIESNTVDVTVAKVAGLTNQPSAFTDGTSSAVNTSVLTGDDVSFEFTITNVGNDVSNIHIPDLANIATKGLDPASLALTVDINGNGEFTAITPDAGGNLIVPDVPINGQIIVKVAGTVTATAAGAPIEVLLGDTGSNTDPNSPVTDTQNQPDAGDGETAEEQVKDVRSETATTPTVPGAPVEGQKEASALQQVFLGSNPLAMTRIEKTRVIDNALPANSDLVLDNNVITYNLELEVLANTPNSLYTPGQLEGRDFGARVANVADSTNLVLISDAIPELTILQAGLAPLVDGDGRTWTPVYAVAPDPAIVDGSSPAADQITWDATAPADLTTVTRVGWVYDANSASGPIDPGTTVTPNFTFNVITDGLDPNTGGTVANIAQVFGGTVDGDDVFDESGDQDPSNFNGATPGPAETVATSTGIADPASHGIDSENNNNLNDADPASPGGEDNVITIGAPGTLINGPIGQPAATGNVFGVGPDNNHDFQNQGVDNFPTGAKHNTGTTFDPSVVTFENTLSNPGTTDLSNVLLQPINPEYDPDFNGSAIDDLLPIGTTVTLDLGGQIATYTYEDNTLTADNTTDRQFVLTDGTPIIIPTLAAGVPLNYTVEVDLPDGTGLSTDDAINAGFPVPVIAFVDTVGDENGIPDVEENSNLTVNQVYTGYIKIFKEVAVFAPGSDVTNDGNAKAGMGFSDPDTAKQPLPGDILKYRVIYRNISEPQAGAGNNGILNGLNIMIDENGTIDAFDGAPTVADGDPTPSGNNWGLDNNNDGDIDTINVQNTAEDSNGGSITFFTEGGATLSDLTPAGTVDPGDTVTGYRTEIELLAPTGAEATIPFMESYQPNQGDSAFTFQREVDEFDGLAEEGLENPEN